MLAFTYWLFRNLTMIAMRRSRKRPSPKVNLLIIFTLCTIGREALAEDFYEWQVWGYWATHSPSPIESCAYYVSNMFAGPAQLPTFEGVDGISGSYALCHAKYWTGDRWNHLSWEMRRFGSACAPSQNYNEDEGRCATTPSNVGQICAGEGSPTIKLIGSGGNCSSLSNLRSQRGKPDPMACIGNPINLISGNKFQIERDTQYIATPGFEFSRIYNSIDGLWRHNYSQSLRIGPSIITFIDADGRESYFNSSDMSPSEYSAPIGILKQDGSDWSLAMHDNSVYRFDSSGLLIGILLQSSEPLALTRYNGTLKVMDSKENYLLITEDILHQPTSLTLPKNNFQYIYDYNKRLTTVTHQFNNTSTSRTYTYDAFQGRALLTGIVDERGIPIASWTYDDQQRANKSQHVGETDKVSIKYDNGTTTIANQFGKISIYRYAIHKGRPLIVSIKGEPSPNCPASDSSYTYDDMGNLLTETDAKGYVTSFAYNARGLQIRRTEATGTPQARTTTTEWDPTRFLRIKVVDPTRTTIYSYDDLGREITRRVTPN